jgi:hypothetical protein
MKSWAYTLLILTRNRSIGAALKYVFADAIGVFFSIYGAGGDINKFQMSVAFDYEASDIRPLHHGFNKFPWFVDTSNADK